MKVAISRFVVVAAIAALVVVCGSTAAWAQSCPDASPNFSHRFHVWPSCMTLNGTNPQFLSTSNSGPVILRLTPNAGNQVGLRVVQQRATGARRGSAPPSSSYFRITTQTPADGIAFVIQSAHHDGACNWFYRRKRRRAWDTETATAAQIRARGQESRTAWQSNSIPTRTDGIPMPSTVASATLQFRVAARVRTPRTMATHAAAQPQQGPPRR